jgi:hypothetical protein
VKIGIGKFLRDGLTLAGIESAFRRVTAAITAGFQIEHKEDGTHKAITASAITITEDTGTDEGTGDVTADGDGTFGGDVVALNGTDEVCGIGVLSTVNGAAFQAGEAIRYGVLIGGTSGFWIEQRPIGSPFNGGTNELRLWHLSHDAATPMLRIGLISSVPTIMDGGTGSTAIDLGSATRYLNDVYASQFFRSNYAAAQGEWTTVAHSAGNFTASSGTWTVASGDQIAFAYTLIGKTMTVNFRIDTSSVSATPATLRIAIPGGFTAASDAYNGGLIYNDAGGGYVGGGSIFVIASGTVINLQEVFGTSTWAAATDTTSVLGQITFEIQ